MTRDNILFAIIGVLLGFIIGFLFASNAIQNTPVPRTTAPISVSQNSESSATESPALPSNPVVADESAAPPEGLQDAVQRAKSEPKNFDAQVEAAQRLYENRRYDEAIELFQRANGLRPDDYETMTALANTYFDAGRYEDAEKRYTAALAKKPDDANVRTDLGLTFFFRKPPDMNRAIKEFRTALQYDPNHEQTLINLIVVLTEKGDAKEAGQVLAQLEKVSPNNAALPKLRSRVEGMTSSK
jgi:tetratricopeptide (TPR) repeat protein